MIKKRSLKKYSLAKKKCTDKIKLPFQENRLVLKAEDLFTLIAFNTTAYYMNIYLLKSATLSSISKIPDIANNQLNFFLNIDNILPNAPSLIAISLFLALLFSIFITIGIEYNILFFRNLVSNLDKYYNHYESKLKIYFKNFKNKTISSNHKKISTFVELGIVSLIGVTVYLATLTSPSFSLFLFLSFALLIVIRLSTRAITVYTVTVALLMTFFTGFLIIQVKIDEDKPQNESKKDTYNFEKEACTVTINGKPYNYDIQLELKNGLLVKDKNKKYKIIFNHDINSISY